MTTDRRSLKRRGVRGEAVARGSGVGKLPLLSLLEPPSRSKSRPTLLLAPLIPASPHCEEDAGCAGVGGEGREEEERRQQRETQAGRGFARM